MRAISAPAPAKPPATKARAARDCSYWRSSPPSCGEYLARGALILIHTGILDDLAPLVALGAVVSVELRRVHGQGLEALLGQARHDGRVQGCLGRRCRQLVDD